MTWSVATPTWVAPPSSICSTVCSTPVDGAEAAVVGLAAAAAAVEMAKQLVCAVDEVNDHAAPRMAGFADDRVAVRPHPHRLLGMELPELAGRAFYPRGLPRAGGSRSTPSASTPSR